MSRNPNRQNNKNNGSKKDQINANISNLENEEFKKLLRKENREIKLKLEQEEKYLNMYNLEKERFNNLWIISKKDAEDVKSEILIKERELADVKESNIISISLYNQKVKQLKFKNQDTNTEKQIEIERKIKELEDGNKIMQKELEYDNRMLIKKMKENKLANDNFKFGVDFDGEKQSIKIRQEYERQARELKAFYDLKMKKITDEMEEERVEIIKKLEADKEEKIKEITSLHSQEYKNLKNYYNDITASILSCIKQLKTDIEKAQAIDDRDKKKILRIEEQNLKLSDPLENNLSEIAKLEKMTKDFPVVEKQKDILRENIQKLDMEIKQIEFEYEVKLQQFEYLKSENNILLEKYEENLLDINQKNGLKNLVIEKKTSLAMELLEIKNSEIKKILLMSDINDEQKS